MVYISILICFLLYGFFAYADTIYLEDNTELKGIVVEEYRDRIVISTYKGEVSVLRKNVKTILYDLPEQNLLKLGDSCKARGEYDKAYFYYEKAWRINPDNKLAQDGMNYIIGYMFRKTQQEKLEDIKRMEEFENWPGQAPAQEDFEKDLANQVGMRIAEEKDVIRIESVIKDSPAFIAGIRKDDTLISVWGKLTGYMSREEAARLILEKGIGEIKIGVERNIIVEKEPHFFGNYRDIIGGKLDMLLDGLTLVDIENEGPGQKAGLKKGDLVVAVNRDSTRYMPLKDAIKIIEDKNTNAVVFTIRRDVTIWRR